MEIADECCIDFQKGVVGEVVCGYGDGPGLQEFGLGEGGLLLAGGLLKQKQQ